MKYLLSSFICSIGLLQTICGQGVFRLSGGTQMLVNNNVRIVFNNTSYENNGITGIASNARWVFTGNSPLVTISGSSNTLLSELELNKSFGNLQLNRPVNILTSVIFTGGNLNLNGQTLFLVADPNGQLLGENNNSHIVGATGQVRKQAVLNAPVDANPGNMGIFITAAQNLGATTIDRLHYSVNNQSVSRVFHITPTNNSGLNATLRFLYLDAEAAGFDKNLLNTWRSATGNSGWANQGGTPQAAQNTVTLNNVNDFSWFTLAQSNAALPLVLAQFNTRCMGNQVQLQWQTSLEQNTSHFELQKSYDGSSWAVIGSVTAAGNSSLPLNYSYNDAGGPQVKYRLRMVDKDGQFTYSKTISSPCNTAKWQISAYPNPVTDKLTLFVTNVNRHRIPVTMFNTLGAAVWQKEVVLSGPSTSITIPVSNLPAGTYFIKAGDAEYKTNIIITKQQP